MNVVATLGQLAAARAAQPDALDADVLSGPLDPGTFGRLLCDAVLYPTLLDQHGAVLVPGRDLRFVTAAQSRALIARDRGCIVPGCKAPPSRCQAHHVVWWRNNGRTDIGSLALLCDRHHSAVHAGHWTLQMIDGVPWVIPPAWLDPSGVPRRNTVAEAEHRARTLAQRLRNPQLTLDLPDGQPHSGKVAALLHRLRASFSPIRVTRSTVVLTGGRGATCCSAACSSSTGCRVPMVRCGVTPHRTTRCS